MTSAPTAQQTWDKLHLNKQTYIPLAEYSTAAGFFGDLTGRRLLDVGCGLGESSLFFARQGAHVVAIDNSPVAVKRLRKRIELQQQPLKIEPICMDAMDIDSFEPFDFIFGYMILHHLEPFGEFAAKLSHALSANGRAFFYENNAANPFLIFCRNHVVGRFGVPKYGDDEEHPLTDAEVSQLQKLFSVRREYPDFQFFRKLNYIAGRQLPIFASADRWAGSFAFLRRYSYNQALYITRK